MPRLGVPHTLFFDWHGTLADTFEAMYRAVEEMLPQLGALGLEEQDQRNQNRASKYVLLATYLDEFARIAGADELITAHASPTIDQRLRSVDLLADAMNPVPL